MTKLERNATITEVAYNGVRVFVVFDTNLIIAADLCDALELTGPCRIVRVATVGDLTAALVDVPEVFAAFIEVGLDDLAPSGLDVLLRDRNAHIVLTIGETDAARGTTDDVSFLMRPFSEQMIHQSVAIAEMGKRGDT